MGSGFDSFSLAVFTALSPAGVVGFLCLALPLLFSSLETGTRSKINRFLAIPLAVALMGFIASATHLGTPSNALHVFSGIGRSPLSNEVLAAVAFLALGGSYWMMAFKVRFPRILARIWLALACTAGILFIAMTSIAYSVDTVPTWNSLLTPINLVFSALLPGPVIALFSYACAHGKANWFRRSMLIGAGLALAIGSVLLFIHDASLATIANDEMSAVELVPDYFELICLHVLLGSAGVACASLSLKRSFSRRQALILLGIASILALIAVFIPRTAFYAMHMTVGF